jgi:hypothetical protein
MRRDSNILTVDDGFQLRCRIEGHPQLLDSCAESHGSHSTTFIIYFTLYLVYKVSILSYINLR